MLNPDVREILLDPDVGGGVTFQVRRPRQVRNRGSVELVYTEYTAVGNIQPASKSAAQSTNEDQLDEQIVIRTTFILQAGSRETLTVVDDVTGEERTETAVYQADEVIYHGYRWRVTRLDNWEDWGFVTAYATRVRE